MTPQQIEALKLALEALEGFYEYGYDRQECFEHITAIKEALLEHAMQEVQRLGQEIEQEPLAWRNAAIRVGEDLSSVGPFGYYDMTAEQWLDWALSVVTVHAPPAQRTWVGLTEQDLDYLCNLAYTGDEEFALAVQAKLMEKNA